MLLMLSGYPNPARIDVNIRLGIPSTCAGQVLDLDVYDVLGRHVKQVYRGELQPGFYELHWDGTNTADAEVSSGIYFLQVTSRDQRVGKKVVLVR
jgi:flagellar hook assembly protein FlgD